jgi:hypothetical protein
MLHRPLRTTLTVVLFKERNAPLSFADWLRGGTVYGPHLCPFAFQPGTMFDLRNKRSRDRRQQR